MTSALGSHSLGLNPKNETLGKGTVEGKELQVAKKRVGRYPNEFRPDGGGAAEQVREHCGAL